MNYNALKTLYEHGKISKQQLWKATQPPLNYITEDEYRSIVGE